MFEIFNETGKEIKELKQINELLKKVIKNEFIEDAIFNVIIIDNERIHEINREYRLIDKPTDVISFALEDTEEIAMSVRVLGDIYISLDKAISQANEYNHSLLRELSFLTIHGLLHLLGYDHMEKEDEKIMFKKQEDILNEANIIE